MKFALDLMEVLVFRGRALRSLALSRNIVSGAALFATGIVAFAVIRSRVYSALRAAEGLTAGGFPLYDVAVALLFVLAAYIPAVVSLSNAMAGDGLGFSVTTEEYRAHAGVLLSLWGALFLLTAPVQWVLPHFVVLVPGLLTISVARLLLTVALSVYTVWAIRSLNHLDLLPATGVFMVSWLTWPVFYVLSTFIFALPLFILIPLGYLASRALRSQFRERVRERDLQSHLRSLTANPRDADAHHQLGLICLQRGKLDEAERRFRAAAEVEPDDPDHHYELGRVFEARGDWPRALEEYEQTYRLDPQYRFGDIIREVGKGYLHADRPDKAQEFLDFFLTTRESDPEARYWLAVTLGQLGRPVESRAQLSTILAQARSNPRFFRREHREWLQRARRLLRSPADR